MGDQKKILVVGDVMIDQYIHVVSDRLAPEAPIPVWDEVRRERRLGGAANVAHNLKALGGYDVEVFLAGIVSQYDRKMLQHVGIDTVLCNGSETMFKTRYVDDQERYLLRSDNIKKFSDESRRGLHTCLKHFLRGHKFDAVIFSDYNKGTIDPETVSLVVSPDSGIVVVDSKRVDLTLYKGAGLLKINEHEYSTQVARGPYTNVESLFEYVVVTHGAKGAELRQQEVTKSNDEKYLVHSENFPVEPVVAKDVTGCGDTHTAAMTFSLVKNPDVRRAVRFANACSRNVVQKFGTSVSDVSLASLGV